MTETTPAPGTLTIDGREALAYVILRPGDTDATVVLEAEIKGMAPEHAGGILRHMADQWAPRRDLVGVLDEVAAERFRQDRQWGEQNHPDGTGFNAVLLGRPITAYRDMIRSACKAAAACGEATWALIDLEEDFEALAESDPELLRAELIQSAAVKIAWIQAIDRRAGGRPPTSEQPPAALSLELVRGDAEEPQR